MSVDNRHRRSVIFLAAASLACAPAPRPGDEVRIAEESAIVIWDAATQTQHFIRRASFDTRAKDFGFLVPTPSVPKLEEAEDGAFDLLARITAPAVLPRPERSGPYPAGPPAAAPAVTVVARAKVAGYDAVVLEASDAGALDRWLKEHGYASSAELVEWYKPYIAKSWRITAFKIAHDAANATQVSTKAVRMSFRADKPFFPYREPASARKGTGDPAPRLLRVYFLGEARHEGSIGAANAWPGVTVWSNRIGDADRDRLLKMAKLPSGGAPVWLTEFEDRSSPRPGTDDVYFAISAEQGTLARAPIFDDESDPFMFWIGLLGLAGAVWLGIAAIRRMRRP